MTLNQIEMDMRFVMAVGTGTKHSGETMAGTFAEFVTKLLRDHHIRKAKNAAVGQPERA